MIVHIVLFKFKENTEEKNKNEMIKSLEIFKEKIRLIKNISNGYNFSNENKGYDYCLCLEFDNKENLNQYLKHEFHISFLEKFKYIFEDILITDHVKTKQNKDAKYYIDRLDLNIHFEGGYYSQVYKDKTIIKKDSIPNFDGDRSCSTAIYYLLHKDDYSRFHKIKSDELWHYYDGNTNIKIYEIKINGDIFIHKLGKNLNNDEKFLCVIEKNSWFSAELEEKNIDSFVLAGCTVSPGFETDDFEVGNFENLSKKYTIIIIR